MLALASSATIITNCFICLFFSCDRVTRDTSLLCQRYPRGVMNFGFVIAEQLSQLLRREFELLTRRLKGHVVYAPELRQVSHDAVCPARLGNCQFLRHAA